MLKLHNIFFRLTYFLHVKVPNNGEAKKKMPKALIQDTFSYFCFYILLPLKAEKPHQQIYRYKYI